MLCVFPLLIICFFISVFGYTVRVVPCSCLPVTHILLSCKDLLSQLSRGHMHSCLTGSLWFSSETCFSYNVCWLFTAQCFGCVAQTVCFAAVWCVYHWPQFLSVFLGTASSDTPVPLCISGIALSCQFNGKGCSQGCDSMVFLVTVNKQHSPAV